MWSRQKGVSAVGEIGRMLDEAFVREAQSASTWSHPATVLTSVRRTVARRRATRAASAYGAGALAVGALVFAMLLPGGDGPVHPASPTPSATQGPTASASPTPSPTPTATPTAALTWEDLDDADKPAWNTDTPEGEPASRVLEDWVWGYVTSDWTLTVLPDPEVSPRNGEWQALMLQAPGGDLLRVSELPTAERAAVSAWDPSDRLAWLAFFGGGDSWRVVQYDLASGASDPEWLRDDLAYPYDDAFADGVWNVGKVADIGAGRELWATFSYRGSYEGFFLRDTDGGWSALPGMDVASAAVADGAVDGGTDPGVEAWFDQQTLTVAILLQWGAYGTHDHAFHTSSGQWVVTSLAPDGDASRDTTQSSTTFVPTPPLCENLRKETVPEPASPTGFGVYAVCGNDAWELTPLTADAVLAPGAW